MVRQHPQLVSPPRSPAARPRVRSQKAALIVAAIILVLGLFHLGSRHVSAADSSISSGFPSACLDVLHNGSADGTPVDVADCNGTAAQVWTTSAMAIRHADTNTCVSANSTGSIVLSPCSDAPNQVWLRDQSGYFNPNTGKCMSASKLGSQLTLAGCSGTATPAETWTPSAAAQPPACQGSEGDMVACTAVKQWTAWQTKGSDHNALLTAYTDGTSYEQWCADFVSYVYKQTGYPFTAGSADGWDENVADSIQNMGFNVHQAASGYVPKAGDVAYFDYPGGHVEIVVSGGSHPTFVYGDSATTDPATGNGQMEANTTLANDTGLSGQLVYYLSPGS